MMHLVVILCGIFSFICSLLINANRFIKAVERTGEKMPYDDPVAMVRLWYDYFDDKY